MEHRQLLHIEADPWSIQPTLVDDDWQQLSWVSDWDQARTEGGGGDTTELEKSLRIIAFSLSRRHREELNSQLCH